MVQKRTGKGRAGKNMQDRAGKTPSLVSASVLVLEGTRTYRTAVFAQLGPHTLNKPVLEMR